MPNNPFIDAGSRIEPPVSEPIEPNTMPAPTAAPEPLDEPPKLLAKEAVAAGLPAEEFSAMKLGETRTF